MRKDISASLAGRVLGAFPCLFGLRDRPLRPLHLWMVNLSLVLFALSVAVSVHDARYGCSGDLRGVVASARAMKTGLDPYFYVWKPGMSERLAEYWSIPVKMTRATYPPSLLWFSSLLGGWSWITIRRVHFLLEELCLLALALLLPRSRFHHNDQSRALSVSLVLVAIGCSPIWRVHLVCGQHYVQIALLLGLALACMERERPGWAGFWAAGAMFFRPTMAVVFLPLLMKRQWSAVAGGAVGLALALALSLPVTGLAVYRSAVRANADWDVVGAQEYISDYVAALPIPPALRAERPGTPLVLEGVRRVHLWDPPLEQSYSLLGVSNMLIFAANRLGAHLHSEPGTDYRLRAFRIAGALLLLVACVLLVRWRKPIPGALLLLLGIFLAFAADYMTVSWRTLYSEVLNVLPFGVLAGLLLDRRLPGFHRWCGYLGSGWALASYMTVPVPEGVHAWLNAFSWIGPYSALVFFGGAVVYLIRRQERERPEENIGVGGETVS